jgi:hypothetical protein
MLQVDAAGLLPRGSRSVRAATTAYQIADCAYAMRGVSLTVGLPTASPLTFQLARLPEVRVSEISITIITMVLGRPAMEKLGPGASRLNSLLLSFSWSCNQPATWDPCSVVRSHSESILMALDLWGPITGEGNGESPCLCAFCCPPFCLGPSSFFMFPFANLLRWN